MRTTASGFALALALLVTGCSGTVQDASAPSPDDSTSATAPAPDSPTASATPEGPCSYEVTGAPAREVDPPSGEEATGNPRVTLQTSRGDVPIELDTDLAPCTVASFLSLAEQDYYDDTPCHRLTTEGIFVLQCGDPTGSGAGGPGYQFADEVDDLTDELQCSGGACIYPAGTVAMANAGPGTNGSQFFLVYEDSPLPPNYTVFGEMTGPGLRAVAQVGAAGTEDGANPADGPPAQDTEIEVVTGLPSA